MTNWEISAMISRISNCLTQSLMIIRLKKAIQEYVVCSSTWTRIEGFTKMLQSRCHPHFSYFGIPFQFIVPAIRIVLQASGSFGKKRNLIIFAFILQMNFFH
jgi:hypothetical protein